MSNEELKAFEKIKALVPTAHHGPKPNCKYCKGTGFRHKHIPATKHLKEIDGDFPCICLFVDHEYTEEMQGLINQTVAKLRGKNE